MISVFKLLIILVLSIASPIFSANNFNLIIMVPIRRAMGAYGDDQVLTPNLDRLASHGARFDNAYAAAPVCSPSRAALLSGQYPSQVGINDFLMLNENYSNQGMDVHLFGQKY